MFVNEYEIAAFRANSSAIKDDINLLIKLRTNFEKEFNVEKIKPALEEINTEESAKNL